MPAVLPILYWVERAMLVVMPLLLAIRMVLAPDGTVLVVFNVLLAVAMVIAVLPVASFLLEKFANYNEGANWQRRRSGGAFGSRLSRRCRSGSPRCARANGSWRGGRRVGGTCSRGSEIVYHYGEYFEDLGTSMESAAERLAAAKAAVAALSGKPVSATPAEVGNRG